MKGQENFINIEVGDGKDLECTVLHRYTGSEELNSKSGLCLLFEVDV